MLYKNNLAEKCVVKGDSKVFSIASASVLAKVSRDHKMEELHGLYPAYEFAAHKGYSTPLHLERLRREGPCPEHRRSFSPVSEVLTLFS
jgi:ribonuclease HII